MPETTLLNPTQTAEREILQEDAFKRTIALGYCPSECVVCDGAANANAMVAQLVPAAEIH